MMNQQPPMQGIANQMAQHGRYGDSMLVHMNPVEVQGIAALSPTGSLTTNPVTGQPEAFLPFLAPLLGSALGSTFLTGAGAGALGGLIGTAGLSSGLAGAIGSGLATTAVTGDLKKGLVSGLTGYGVGQALGAASKALSPEVIDAAGTAGELAEQSASFGTEITKAQTELAGFTPGTEAYTQAADKLSNLQAAQTNLVGQGALPAGVQGPVDIGEIGVAQENLARLSNQAQSGVLAPDGGGMLARMQADPMAFARATGSQLIKPANLAAIGVGEGQRGAIEMQERFARDAGRFQDERDAELERARQNMRTAYGQLESDYPGYKIPGYQAGGITSVNTNNYMANLRGLQALAGGGRTVQNFNQGGRSGRFAEPDDYSQYTGTAPIFGSGTAAQRQANIRGSQVISPEQLQGYRPGFDPEINYFQRPAAAPAPAPGPGTPPGTIPGGPPGTPPGTIPGGPPGGPGRGGPAMGGGLGGFDYREFLDSDEGRQAMETVRGALGIPDFSTIDNRLASIEARPNPTIPQIDYDEITNRVRGGINIPEFDLSGIDSRLAAIESREIPSIDYDAITSRVREGIDIPEYTSPQIDYDLITNRVREGIDIPEYTPPQIDYDLITSRVREGIDIPSFDTSNIMDAISANREAISSMPSSPMFDYDEIANRVRSGIDIPDYDFSGIESRLGAIENREMPTFDTSGLMSAIDANRQAISGIPSIDFSGIENRLGAIENREIPSIDYDAITSRVREGIDIPNVDFSGIENRLGAIESREMPVFDTSGIMSAIDANRQAITGMPSIDLSGIEARLGSIEGREIPEIDYDAITSRVREGIDIPAYDTSGIMSAIDANRQAISGIPSVDLSGIEGRLGAIEGREMPTFDTSGLMSAISANREAIAGMPAPSPVDYNEIANRVRGSIDIPAVDLSGIETRLGAIEGREMPTFDLSGIESRLGAIEGREMPTFDTSGLMSAIDANRQAIAGLPAPAPTFDSSGLMDAIAANRQAISNLPAPAPTVDLSGIESRLGAIEGRADPTFDTSGIMEAIAANRSAISGIPAPAPAFDASAILAAIEANRKAIGGINSGGINPDPMAGLPTSTMTNQRIIAPTKLAPRKFAEGGETGMPADQGSRIIDLTIAAVMGQLPEEQAEAVVNRFVDEFGSEAFAILRRQVLQGNVPGAQTEGKINGNGGGMDDKVPGMIGDQQPVAVSPGEFIIPADVVSGLGDGSTDAGVEELHGMMDKVRKERTGTRQQPRPVDKAKVMPV